MFYIVIAVALFFALSFGFFLTLQVDKKIDSEQQE